MKGNVMTITALVLQQQQITKATMEHVWFDKFIWWVQQMTSSTSSIWWIWVWFDDKKQQHSFATTTTTNHKGNNRTSWMISIQQVWQVQFDEFEFNDNERTWKSHNTNVVLNQIYKINIQDRNNLFVLP